jgi:hypothetical protein
MAVYLNTCGLKEDVMHLTNNPVLSSGENRVINGHQSAWPDIP